MTGFSTFMAAGALGLALAGPLAAETYRISYFQQDGETTVVAGRWFAEQMAERTGGRIEFDFFTGSVLFPPKAHLQSIGAGVVQEGSQNSGYTPSELPLSNALSSYGFLQPDPTTMGAAYADWVMHDPAAQDEYLSQNVVPVGGFSTPNYPIICNTRQPVTSLEQFRGLKIRWPGGASAKLTQDLGAIPVNIPGNEIYQALQNGSIDCAGILAAWLNIDNSLEEVSRSTTVLDWVGSYISPAQNWNRDFWTSISAEDRALVFELAARTQAKIQIRFNTDSQKALETAAAKGHQVVEPDDSIREAVAQWVDDGVGDMAGVARDTYGVADPEALFASFAPYVEKWTALVEGMEDRNDEDAFTQLLLDNLYNDLDPAAYGTK
ncbi:C4-dicarboxylate TRAP transporter substrate-binding protein [Mangrovicoccus ximenensis]|uniref:C4-dicarboxylate TRAP transporter substrate-binding protein n=1 Tax=Mangrovicoccus ximenensis TaxID=1911570 RepID=UPI000D3C5BAF|nr:C4-dicarboxylate TRAP transporter substrate-binding protein [Mangrovicoccus ximenensis]